MTSQSPDNLSFASFALAGPARDADPACQPVRGDLAHVRLAGDVFVPHYAVPMAHRAIAVAELRTAARADAGVIATVEPGTAFDVLDIAGEWAWGSVGGDGLVGYLPLVKLEKA